MNNHPQGARDVKPNKPPRGDMSNTIEITVTRKEKVAVKYLKVEAGVRYWEDATVNGLVDEDGTLIPCRDGDCWSPVIDLATGIIEGWPANTLASIHYKVCDAGRYALLDADRNEVCAIDGYVPAIMCPGDDGYGDYIIMSVGPDGQIANWTVDLDRFEEIGE